MTTPLVTVVIPAYNAAATIQRAVDSVLAQTFEDYEIVVVDDGSKDTTSEIVAAYDSDKVRLLRLPGNLGQSGATNHGIAAARGEFIAFLDADDEWLPTKLAKQVKVLRDNPAAVMASCGCRFVDAQGGVLREFGIPPAMEKSEVWRRLLVASFVAKPCVVARASVLRDVGPFDTTLVVAEDQDMWIRLSLAGEVEFVREFLTTVHDTPGSLTKVHIDKVENYVLPMIRRHIAAQRRRLSAAEVNEVLGARYTFVGRNHYTGGAALRGARLILKAVARGHRVRENLWYLAAASPPAKLLKQLLGYRRVAPPTAPSLSAVVATGGSLLAPQRQDFVALPPGPPILMVMIDTEAEFDWNGPFLRSHMNVRNIREQVRAQEIFDRFGLRPTYLVDYAVASQPEGYEPIREILRSGRCEVGTHLQPWETPPYAEELGTQTSFQHNLPAWLQKEKLQHLTEAIVASFGVRPVCFRAGRYGVGDEIAWILQHLGYQIDLSVLPGHDLRKRHGPDFRRAFAQPYWFGEDRRLLEIPLTSGYSGLLPRAGASQMLNATVYTALAGPYATRLHLPGVFARLDLLERIMLTPEGVAIQDLKRLTRTLLRRGQQVFTFNYHSSALLPGATPYVTTPADLDRLLRTIEEYLHFFIEEVGGVTMTPVQLRAALLPRSPTAAHDLVAERTR
ncbi:MAG: glycosyltransferase [Acetobacteraceae bacterium]|jgi:glycosyltransferase involved in cell wall biosynthesis